MIRIRLQRTGRRNLAHYRVVVAEKKAPVKGKFIEKIGWYDPHAKKLEFHKDRVLHWLNIGAQPSNTVSKLLKQKNIIHKLIVIKVKPPRKPKSEQPKTDEQSVKVESPSEPTAKEGELKTSEQQAS